MRRYRGALYLNKEKAKLAGVCAGIADYLGWNVTFIRIGWVIGTLISPPVMIVGYLLIAWLAEPKPQSDLAPSKHSVPSDSPRPPEPTHRRLSEAKARFDRLERRLRAMESVVTSREFQIDRELKGAGGTN